MFSDDIETSITKFKEFNEQNCEEKCLDDMDDKRKTDEEAGKEIKK